MPTPRLTYGLIGSAFLLLATGFVGYTITNKYHKSVARSDERELKVTLEAGYGTVSVSRGEAATILDANIES
jgi:hypothetical protein